MMHTYIKYIILMVAMLCVSCHNHSHQPEQHDHDDENPFVVHFSDEMQTKVDFAVAKAERRNVGTIIETVAQVQASQTDESVICAKVDGVISLKGKSLTPGCSISAGQAIGSINASATANNNLSTQQQQAQTEYNRAKAEYERIKTLRSENLALESEVVNAKAAMDNALSQLKALQNGFAGGTQTVSASTSGFLKQLSVKEGQYVQAGEQIAVISKSQNIQLQAEVPVRYYNILKDIYDANIRIKDSSRSEGETVSLLSLGGKMLSYGHQTSTDSPLLPVTFEIRNVVDLVPGTFVDMFIKTKSTEEKVCVAAEAVLEEMGNWFVYVQTKPEHFEKRLVKIGASDGLYTEITSGINEGEIVVSRGAMLVKLQQAAGSVDAEAGHSHSH